MKYFITITLIAAVASVAVVRPLRSENAEIQEIIAAIQSPSTNPATAAALKQVLLDILLVKLEPIAVGPVINPIEGIAVGPAIVDDFEPIAVGPAIVEEPAIIATPVIIAPNPAPAAVDFAASHPLVQIILCINEASSSPINIGPIVVAGDKILITPELVQVVEVAHEPVQVVEVAPIPTDPVQIGVPIIPEAAVVHPEELN